MSLHALISEMRERAALQPYNDMALLAIRWADKLEAALAGGGEAVAWRVVWTERGVPCTKLALTEVEALEFYAKHLHGTAAKVEPLFNQECQKVWDRRGGNLYLDREESGVVVDALIEHKASACKRKGDNPASNSDARSEMCAAIIGRINAAAGVITCGTCQGGGTIDETLGGYAFSNPAATCPDCDGLGEISTNPNDAAALNPGGSRE